MTIKEYAKKNWRAIVLMFIVAALIFFNVKQYQGSQVILRENEKINNQYQALLEREVIYDQQISDYRSQISKKDALINSEKNKVEKTEAKLQVSQGEARRLSAKIKSLNTDIQEELQAYVETCDSLSIVAPILANQVDTLKSQNKILVSTLEEKSVIQDSIIKKKDIIIVETKTFLATAINGYNKATEKLVFTEDKLNKEKKRKSFWKKATVALVAGVAGIFILK